MERRIQNQNFFQQVLNVLYDYVFSNFHLYIMFFLADLKLGKSLIKFFIVGALLFFSIGYLGYFLFAPFKDNDIVFATILAIILVRAIAKFLFLLFLFFPVSGEILCKKMKEDREKTMKIYRFFKNKDEKYCFLVSLGGHFVFSFAFAIGTLMSHNPIYFFLGVWAILDAALESFIEVLAFFKCKKFKNK